LDEEDQKLGHEGEEEKKEMAPPNKLSFETLYRVRKQKKVQIATFDKREGNNVIE
jgi:hypothetical protein